jgi:hypothetical protein
MYKGTFIILFLLVSLSSFSLNSLDSDTITKEALQCHFLNISGSYNYYKYLDNQISPLLYKGSLAGLNLGFESDGERYKYQIILGGNIGYLTAQTENVAYSANQYLLNLKINYLHKIGNKTFNFSKYLGANIQTSNIFFENRSLQNASLTYTSINHLALSAEIERQISWKAKKINIWFIKINRRDRELKFNFRLDVPLYFYNIRPPYSTISDFTDGQSTADFSTKSFWIFANAFQLNTTTSITYYLHNSNAFRFTYYWQSYKFTDTFDSYQAAQHTFEFSLLLRFN